MRRFLAARHRYRHLLNADVSAAAMTRIPSDGASALVPFARYRVGTEGVLVVGNDLPWDVEYHLHVPVDLLGLGGAETVRVVDILGQSPDQTLAPRDLENFTVPVGADYPPRGGIRAFHPVVVEGLARGPFTG